MSNYKIYLSITEDKYVHQNKASLKHDYIA